MAKGKGCLTWIGGAVVALLAFVIIISLLSEKSSEPPEKARVFGRGEPIKLGAFRYTLLDNPGPIFTRKLGGEYFKKEPSEGALFLLVPIRVENISSKTESLPLTLTWKVFDLDEGLEYRVSTGADIYLNEEQKLDPYDIAPGASRWGMIVFEINEGSREHRLVLEISAIGIKRTRFKINF